MDEKHKTDKMRHTPVGGEADTGRDGAKGGKGAREDEVKEEGDAGGRNGEQMAMGKEGGEIEGGGEEEATGQSAEHARAEEERGDEFWRHD